MMLVLLWYTCYRCGCPLLLLRLPLLPSLPLRHTAPTLLLLTKIALVVDAVGAVQTAAEFYLSGLEGVETTDDNDLGFQVCARLDGLTSVSSLTLTVLALLAFVILYFVFVPVVPHPMGRREES